MTQDPNQKSFKEYQEEYRKKYPLGKCNGIDGRILIGITAFLWFLIFVMACNQM